MNPQDWPLFSETESDRPVNVTVTTPVEADVLLIMNHVPAGIAGLAPTGFGRVTVAPDEAQRIGITLFAYRIVKFRPVKGGSRTNTCSVLKADV